MSLPLRRSSGLFACLLVGCVPAAFHPTSLPPAPAEAAALRLDELSPYLREKYALEAIRVMPWDAAPAAQIGYTLVDGRGQLTENELARRHQALTGSDALARDDRDRHPWHTLGVKGAIISGVVLTLGIGAAVLTGRVRSSNSNGPTGSGDPLLVLDKAVLLAGVGGMAASLYAMSADSGDREGGPTDHSLTREEAERFVADYDLALARRLHGVAARDAADVPVPKPRVQVTPVLSFGGAGLAGTF